jgi:two-component system copper resistance phosphate regulon response regulator CusR
MFLSCWGIIKTTIEGSPKLQVVAVMRILVIEDEEKLADIIARGLKAEGFAVDVTHTAQEGLDQAKTSPIDLVILDLLLPDFSGTDLLRQLREVKRDIPVLVLTARGELDVKAENFSAGADDYLTKPFAFAELVMRIKALLRRGPATVSTSLKIADLELDRVTHHVRRAGKKIDLSRKEFGILEYFIMNPGRVLSRSMIIERVWDQSFEGLTNIVDVYVRQLRKKIDDDFEPKLIRTVRGLGYAIDPQGEL